MNYPEYDEKFFFGGELPRAHRMSAPEGWAQPVLKPTTAGLMALLSATYDEGLGAFVVWAHRIDEPVTTVEGLELLRAECGFAVEVETAEFGVAQTYPANARCHTCWPKVWPLCLRHEAFGEEGERCMFCAEQRVSMHTTEDRIHSLLQGAIPPVSVTRLMQQMMTVPGADAEPLSKIIKGIQ